MSTHFLFDKSALKWLDSNNYWTPCSIVTIITIVLHLYQVVVGSYYQIETEAEYKHKNQHCGGPHVVWNLYDCCQHFIVEM